MILHKKRLVLGAYLFLALFFVPMLTPLRQLQMFSPALVLIGSIPILVMLIVMMLGHKCLIFRSYMSLALVLAFVQAALIGLDHAIDGNIRSYLSHLFQLFSAIVMLAAGTHWSDDFGKRFWRRFAMMAIFAASASTLMSLRVWDAGEINRYYTPAYILIFVVAFSLAVRPEGKTLTIGSILVAIISNKRGPLLSVVLMILTYFFSRLFFFQHFRFRFPKRFLIVFICTAVATLITVIVISDQDLSKENGIVRAFDQTTSRLLKIVRDNPEEINLATYSAGRVEEIESGLEALDGIALLIGNGAGWNVTLGSGKVVQNLHVTPISLAVVFGLPFAAFFYLHLIFLIVRNIRPCIIGGTITEKIALFYLIGSILHTLVAFSIFIDLLNFFFIGVLVNFSSKHSERKYRARDSHFPLTYQASY
jgi:hypothetical protein